MAIKYTPQTGKKEIEVDGYGKFTVRPYGAGEELQIRANLRELDGIRDRAKALAARHKDRKKEEEIPKGDQEELANLAGRTDELAIEIHEILKGTISSEIEGAVDKLFSELSHSEIRNIIDAALIGKGGKGEEDADT